jgi:hypothetical protein
MLSIQLTVWHCFSTQLCQVQLLEPVVCPASPSSSAAAGQPARYRRFHDPVRLDRREVVVLEYGSLRIRRIDLASGDDAPQAALSATFAPVALASAASPPTWSKCSWLVTIQRMSSA